MAKNGSKKELVRIDKGKNAVDDHSNTDTVG